jgi:hypothetical protein
MKQQFWVIVMITTWLSAVAQPGSQPLETARSLSMGGSGTALEGVESCWSNPAGIARLGLEQAVTVTAQQPAWLPDVRLLAAAYVRGMRSGSWSIAVQHTGHPAYYEQRISMGYGRVLSSRLLLGVQIHGLQVAIPTYGSARALSAAIGMQAAVSEAVSIGFRLLNPFRTSVLEGEYLPACLAIGIRYRPAEQLLLLAEAEKDIQASTQFRAGIDYRLHESFSCRLGLASRPVRLSVGAGLRLQKSLWMDIAIAWHHILGLHPAVSLIFGV